MRLRLTLMGWWLGILFLSAESSALLQVVDADGKTVILNARERITVVMVGNEDHAEAVRAAGRALYPLQGQKKFRVVVMMDLRDSMASWAKGYVKRRMRRDLDQEAERLKPFYQKNGNPRDPRSDLSALPDFTGSEIKKLGWETPTSSLRVVVFGLGGRELQRWEALENYQELFQVVAKALGEAERANH